MGVAVEDLEFKHVRYEHDDAQLLIAEVQQEYVHRYGSPDETPIKIDEFDPPSGLFVIAYLGSEPIGTGAWRRVDEILADEMSEQDLPTAAEIKRMYVRRQFRGRGYSRVILEHLERTARAAGAGLLVLETGLRQPEAISLYRSSGYSEVRPFGHYAHDELSVHLGKDLGAV